MNYLGIIAKDEPKEKGSCYKNKDCEYASTVLSLELNEVRSPRFPNRCLPFLQPGI